MASLKYKIVSAVEGATSISAMGLSLTQIIKVARQGEQKDYVGFLSLPTMTGSEWTYLARPSKRIYFSSSFPFGLGEKVYIMYK